MRTIMSNAAASARGVAVMFSMRQAVARTGLSARQIRYYEQQGLITVERTEGKQRRFSAADIERLRLIKQLVEEHAELSEVRERLGRLETAPGEDLPRPEQPARSDLRALMAQQSTQGKGLTSLYPVSDRSELVSLLRAMELHRSRKPKH